MPSRRTVFRVGGAMAIAGFGLAIATPAFATTSFTQTVTGTVPLTITLTETTPGVNLSTLTPGTTATGTEPVFKVAANETYHLSVTPSAWPAGHLTHPLRLVTSAAAGAGDTNTAPAGSTKTITWGSLTKVDIGTGTAVANATTPGTVNPDTFHGVISQPISYADTHGNYHVTLTYTASATV